MPGKGNLHISLDLNECANVADLKTQSPRIVRRILKLARRAGCTVRKKFHDMYEPEDGYTLFVTVAESHFEIHTWPEAAFVNADIFICNHTRNNMMIARRLEKALIAFYQPGKVKRWAKLRGPAKV